MMSKSMADLNVGQKMVAAKLKTNKLVYQRFSAEFDEGNNEEKVVTESEYESIMLRMGFVDETSEADF